MGFVEVLHPAPERRVTRPPAADFHTVTRLLGVCGLAVGAIWGSGANAEPNACELVRQACASAGFSQGGAAEGLGLKRDCFDPIVLGTAQPRGARRALPRVDPQTIAACNGNASAPAQDSDGRQAAGRGRGARFTPADGGQTVHDGVLHVTWLVDANLPARLTFDLPVNANGSMNYTTAQKWVAELNRRAFLGHANWTLPATQRDDPSCNTRGPQRNRFGYGCRQSPMGSLYYDSDALNLQENQTAVPMPPTQTGPFRNVQPYLYWTDTSGNPNNDNKAGYITFSFDTGWTGSNVYQHAMYAWPMIKGNPFGAPSPPDHRLQPVPGGEAVYDPGTDITWAADANLALTSSFHVSGANADGSLQQTPEGVTAFLSALNHYEGRGYLGRHDWRLPSAAVGTDPPCGGYNCAASPLGELYYGQLRLRAGQSAVPTPSTRKGPFEDLQPYLYWSCEGDPGASTCNGNQPAPKFAWSFSFGNGFSGTDLYANDLFVMVYYPDDARPAPEPPRFNPRGGCGRVLCQ